MSKAARRRRRALIAAGCWAAFGVIGLIQFAYWLATTPGAWDRTISTPIAASIPILFTISIAANIHASLAEASADDDG